MARTTMPAAITAASALLAGVLLVQWLAKLPPPWCLGLLLLVVALLAWRCPRWRWLACLLFGMVWAAWRGGAAMEARLPRTLEGRDLVVIGTMADLPLTRTDASRFTLRVEQATLDDGPVALHGEITVSWYEGAPVLQPCTRWHLLLRLKRPRGLLDPGSADSERSALERGIVATGYVRDDDANELLAGPHWCVDGVRDAVARGIAARVHDPHDAALLQAFSVGDTRGLTPRDWEIARANGVSHLIAISGFHVGVAAIFGVWLAMLGHALWPRLGLWLPRPQSQAAAALLVAAAYSALAGFGLPTVRTLLMIAVVALARCSRRGSSGAQSLALAMIAILLVDPLAVLAAGFWLSFVGVAFLMLCLQARGRGLRAFLHELTAGQLVMTVALLPLSLWFFGQASLVGALSNLIAVPLVSFVIVPCALSGMLLLGLCPPLATPVLWLAARIAHAQWWLLEQMASWPGAHWYLPTLQPLALLLALLGALWLFLPRGVPLRWLGLLLFLPLLWPPRQPLQEGAFRVWVLDVGQGLSVLLRTRDHALLYDAGARYPSGFDLGDAVVLPAIHALGITRLDMLMISHGDNDHAGGAETVANAFPQASRYAGEPARMRIPMHQCMTGQSWEWDGVYFRVLNPGRGKGDRDNDSSCVLLVESRGGRLLLTGDVSSTVEPQVAAALGPGPPPILLVPHHGSKTSSSMEFIAAVRPSLALVSAGWHNRFGHPKPEVLARYGAARIPVFNTAEQGAIPLEFPAGAPPRREPGWRLQQPRYWRE
ncbi:DNA internalization-related competence protein ComEC/Rec2 [Rhodanobacter glycinis]|uniref:DNA internalization-related competence protein ComEC/Rec2 n=1 Tax=Rhodanobacter glycinis TaxID=582702 RepID=A0A502C628_9GAMM|nr:DNA internalization-related competence protein ComEC/Rec2 [Rhodanobacter glycinis]TPG08368.1 DNA internalization-related competence protein ComEC/Rec2 [Rhodanobacter glycinis]TPG50244.1 DNA internalization-related competence protein ComEC/Rec2 [Rhodanobacter glycinis]